MIQRVKHVLQEQKVEAEGPVWVAVSGGADSMVLLHVLRALGVACHVAHMDHGLRGPESDGDRQFVEAYCRQYGIPIEVRQVRIPDTSGTGRSVQMVARELRYSWFNELVAKGPYGLALAHHLDDAVETMMMNLMRGMGSIGRGGIPDRNGPFFRPLIHERRGTIQAYAKANGIPFREDSSNSDPKYLRNRVRHELLPFFDILRPGSTKVLGRNVEMLKELGRAAEQLIPTLLADVKHDLDGTVLLPYTTLFGSGMPRSVLGYLLRDLHVHPDRIEDMLLAARSRNTGATFPLDDHVVFIDRECLVLRKDRPAPREWLFNSIEEVGVQHALKVELNDRSARDLELGRDVVWLDPQAMPFPWVLRPWRAGDRMEPLGTGGTKLVSDILIDAKVPRERKDRVHVLEVGGAIAWCCGFRVGQAFVAHPSLPKALKCTWMGDAGVLGGIPL